MDLKQAVIIINVKERPTQRLLASQKNLAVQKDVDSASNEKLNPFGFLILKPCLLIQELLKPVKLDQPEAKFLYLVFHLLTFIQGKEFSYFMT